MFTHETKPGSDDERDVEARASRRCTTPSNGCGCDQILMIVQERTRESRIPLGNCNQLSEIFARIHGSRNQDRAALFHRSVAAQFALHVHGGIRPGCTPCTTITHSATPSNAREPYDCLVVNGMLLPDGPHGLSYPVLLPSQVRWQRSVRRVYFGKIGMSPAFWVRPSVYANLIRMPPQHRHRYSFPRPIPHSTPVLIRF